MRKFSRKWSWKIQYIYVIQILHKLDFFPRKIKKVSSSLPNFYTNPTVEVKKANYICVIHTIMVQAHTYGAISISYSKFYFVLPSKIYNIQYADVRADTYTKKCQSLSLRSLPAT